MSAAEVVEATPEESREIAAKWVVDALDALNANELEHVRAHLISALIWLGR